jgi:hypothetical protein
VYARSGRRPARTSRPTANISSTACPLRRAAQRYQHGSIIFTSNESYSDWGEIFADWVLTTAILDRLLHFSTTSNIRGQSYRLRKGARPGCSRTDRAPEGGLIPNRTLELGNSIPALLGKTMALPHFDIGGELAGQLLDVFAAA